MTFLNKPPWRREGFALILVLWVLSLLTIMAGSFALSMRREASIVESVKNNAEAVAIAESGIAIAEMMLLASDKTKRWRTDGSIYQIDTANARMRVRLLAENGKIDINKAEQKLLESLIAYAPMGDSKQQTQLVGAILDWRDEDDLIHLEGAEKKEYREAGLSYQPRNRPFQSVGELQLVLGMNEAVFKWLEPLITIYSGQPTVNLQQATKEVLQVLPDLDSGLIDDYIAARLASAKQDLPPPPLPAGFAQAAQGGQSQTLTIISEVLLDDGASAIISAVVQSVPTATAPFTVVDWQRNKAGGESLFADILTDTDTITDLIVKHYAEAEFNN